MRTASYYKVKPSVAVRAGVASVRYRTVDGMMILNEQDVRMVRLEPEEYLTGVVEAILTEKEASLLIEQGGRQMGLPAEEPTYMVSGGSASEVGESEVSEEVSDETEEMSDGESDGESADTSVESEEEEVNNE